MHKFLIEGSKGTCVDKTMISRNSMCPCNSGKKYKECHGALNITADSDKSGVLSSAPPYGEISSPLSGQAQLQCDDLLKLAYQAQSQGLVTLASNYLNNVLKLSPHHAGALHNLGLIRLQQGDLLSSEYFFQSLLKMYPAHEETRRHIRLIRQMAQNKEHARSVSEERSALVLPALVKSLLSKGKSDEKKSVFPKNHESQKIHLVISPSKERKNINEAFLDLLEDYNPLLWTGGEGKAYEICSREIKKIDLSTGQVPYGGICIMIDAGERFEQWFPLTVLDRCAYFCWGEQPSDYIRRLEIMTGNRNVPIDLFFFSSAMARHFSTSEERVQVLPPASLMRVPTAPQKTSNASSKSVTVGMVGQHVMHHAVELKLQSDALLALVGRETHMALYDPGRMRLFLGDRSNICFFPRGEEGFQAFLKSTDILICQKEAWWSEADGGGIFDAMASGITVLYPRGSVFSEYISDGIDGFLYRDQAHLKELVFMMKEDGKRRHQLGLAAQEKMNSVFAPLSMKKQYLQALFTVQKI